MKNLLLCFLIVLSSLTVFASKSDEVIGCWSNAGTASRLYVTRDKKFVYTTKDSTGVERVSTGKWKYKKAAHTMHLNFDDRPMLILFFKEMKGGGMKAVNVKRHVDLKYMGAGKCD